MNMKRLLLNKLDQMKITFGEGSVTSVTNWQALNAVFDFWLAHNSQKNTSTGVSDFSNQGKEIEPAATNYQYCSKQDTEEQMYVTTSSAIHHLVRQADNHHGRCSGSLRISSEDRYQHVLKCRFTCDECSSGSFTWTSSPHLPGGKFLTNVRMAHAYQMSGILPVQYQCFCAAANIGVNGTAYMKSLQETYCEAIAAESKHSVEEALREEVSLSDERGITI